MIRILLLAALVAMALATSVPLDQVEWFGARMGRGPFCDSKCLPRGDWKLRRDWIDLETPYEEKFLWFADGGQSFWNSGCGDKVNSVVLTTPTSIDFDTMRACKPEIIYFFEFRIDYTHNRGRMENKVVLDGAYDITDASWESFVNDYQELVVSGNSNQLSTQPWTLLRMSPTLDGAVKYTRYNGKAYLMQTFTANYERNFCTFVGSNQPLQDVAVCDFSDDYDSDSDLTTFISRDFCEWLIGDYGLNEFTFQCSGITDDDDCDSLRVDSIDYYRRDGVEAEPIGRKNPMKALSELILNVRSNSQVSEIPEETVRAARNAKREARDAQFSFDTQAIPGFGEEESAVGWNDPYVYYYVPYTSSITAPYCAYETD